MATTTGLALVSSSASRYLLCSRLPAALLLSSPIAAPSRDRR